MNKNYTFSLRLTDAVRNSKNLLVHNNFLIVTEKQFSANFDLDKVVDVKVSKQRILFINYFSVLIILAFFYTIEKLNFTIGVHPTALLMIKYSLVVVAMLVQIKKTTVIVVTNNLSLKKFVVKYSRQKLSFDYFFVQNNIVKIREKLSTAL